jgi:hypothetical protein
MGTHDSFPLIRDGLDPSCINRFLVVMGGDATKRLYEIHVNSTSSRKKKAQSDPSGVLFKPGWHL